MTTQDILLPADENERLEQVAELARLRAEVKELSVARYIHGPEGCTNGDRECNEYEAEGGEDIEWCSHVEHRIATLADVIRAERLETLVNELREMVTHRERGTRDELAQDVLDLISGSYEAMEHAVTELGWTS